MSETLGECWDPPEPPPGDIFNILVDMGEVPGGSLHSPYTVGTPTQF
jgi:hypothetical protein